MRGWRNTGQLNTVQIRSPRGMVRYMDITERSRAAVGDKVKGLAVLEAR